MYFAPDDISNNHMLFLPMFLLWFLKGFLITKVIRLDWIAGKYIKSLGDATVIAIICGIVTFAIFVSDDDQKMFFSLVDYISFFTLSFSILCFICIFY